MNPEWFQWLICSVTGITADTRVICGPLDIVLECERFLMYE